MSRSSSTTRTRLAIVSRSSRPRAPRPRQTPPRAEPRRGTRIRPGESPGAPGLRLGGFHRSIASGRAGDEGIDQPAGDPEYVFDRTLEPRPLLLRRGSEAAQLPNELERGRPDLVVGGWRGEVEESPD